MMPHRKENDDLINNELLEIISSLVSLYKPEKVCIPYFDSRNRNLIKIADLEFIKDLILFTHITANTEYFNNNPLNKKTTLYPFDIFIDDIRNFFNKNIALPKIDLFILNSRWGKIKNRFYEIECLNKLLDILDFEQTVISLVPLELLYSKYALDLRQRLLDEFCIDFIIDLGCNFWNVKIYSALLVMRKTGVLNEEVCMLKYDGNLDNLINNFKL